MEQKYFLCDKSRSNVTSRKKSLAFKKFDVHQLDLIPEKKIIIKNEPSSIQRPRKSHT